MNYIFLVASAISLTVKANIPGQGLGHGRIQSWDGSKQAVTFLGMKFHTSLHPRLAADAIISGIPRILDLWQKLELNIDVGFVLQHQ